MFSDVRILVGMSDILECTKKFERRILKEERMSERAKTRSLLQRRPLSSLSGVLLVRFFSLGKIIWNEKEYYLSLGAMNTVFCFSSEMLQEKLDEIIE